MQPELVAWTAQYLANGEAAVSSNVALLFPFLLFFFGVGYALSINIKFHILSRLGIQIKGTLQSVLIKKSLRLHVTTTSSGVGAWTNLVSNDTEQIAAALMFLHYLWLSIGFVLVVVVLMVVTVGWAALIGFGCLLILLPLNAKMSSMIGSEKSKLMHETDQRTNIMSQVLEGIEVIKAWSMESAFEEQVTEKRRREMKHLRAIHCMRILLKTALFSTPTLVAVLTLTLARILFHNPLDLIVCLKTLSYLNILRFPLLLIPHALSLLFEARASLSRIETFLNLSECPRMALNEERGSGGGDGEGGGEGGEESGVRISVKGASLRWTPSSSTTPSTHHNGVTTKTSPPMTLRDIHFQVKEGELVGVVGPVGCGKTLLLHGLLGELYPETDEGRRRDHGKEVHRQKDRKEEDRKEEEVKEATITVDRGPSQKICYFSQTPQIFNDTIRGNVLFSEPYEKDRYEQVLHASCLDVDVAAMPQGDETSLGERGVNLSGGQKARVAFARCLYSATSSCNHAHGEEEKKEGSTSTSSKKHPIVLLDDPLSAVDVEVASEMWRRGVLGMLSGATVVVVLSSRVTELLSNCPGCKMLVLSGDGGVLNFGAADEILPSLETEELVDKEVPIVAVSTMSATVPVAILGGDDSIHPPQEKNNASVVVVVKTADMDTTIEKAIDESDERDIILREKRDVGKVRCSVWGWHLALSCGKSSDSFSVGFFLALLLALVFAIGQASKSFTDISMIWYGSLPPNNTAVVVVSAAARPLNDTTTTTATTATTTSAAEFTREWDPNGNTWTLYLYILVLSMWFLSFFRSLIMIEIFLASAKHLHQLVLRRLLRGPLLWFQRRPNGRTLNKFSSDLMKVDLVLPDQAMSFLENSSALLAAFALSVLSVPWLVIVLLPAVAGLVFTVDVFRATSREVIRLDGEARSPVYSSFGDALNARVTLRSFGVRKHLIERTCQHIDTANSVTLLHKMLDRWISMRLNGIMSVYGASLFLASILVKRMAIAEENGGGGGGDNGGGGGGGGDILVGESSVVGLALVYSLQLMGLSSWTAMTFVQTENALTSVERLHQLTSMPQEADEVKKDDPVLDGASGDKASGCQEEVWPTTGSLSIKNLKLRYRPDLPLALNGLNLDVLGGERLGIVGRTGAGKSSVFVSLLRLTEPLEGTSISTLFTWCCSIL